MTSPPKSGSTYNKLSGGTAPYPGSSMHIGDGIDMKIPPADSREMRGLRTISPPPIVPSASPADDLDHRDWAFILNPSDRQDITKLMQKTPSAWSSRWRDVRPEITMSSLGDAASYNIFERERSLWPVEDAPPSAQVSIITNRTGALSLAIPPLPPLTTVSTPHSLGLQ